MTDGKLTKELLLEAGSLKKAEKQLVGIRGIGPWTANYVLMRCLRMPAAFPIDDVGLHNAIKHLLGLEAKPTKKEILELSAGWANWESYATFICGGFSTNKSTHNKEDVSLFCHTTDSWETSL